MKIADGQSVVGNPLPYPDRLNEGKSDSRHSGSLRKKKKTGALGSFCIKQSSMIIQEEYSTENVVADVDFIVWYRAVKCSGCDLYRREGKTASSAVH